MGLPETAMRRIIAGVGTGTLAWCGLLAACSTQSTAPGAQTSPTVRSRDPAKRLAEPRWILESALAGSRKPTLPPDPDWPAPALDDQWAPIAQRIRTDYPDIRAVLIVREGSLRIEQYFGTAAADTFFNVKSVTKSVMSALVGIALRERIIPSLDTRIATWLPEAAEPGVDPRVSRLTVRHLVEMSAGFEWEENGPATTAWLNSDNQIKYMLHLPLRADPGTEFNYSTGVAHLLSVILTRASHRSTREFADDRLFAPLGLRAGPWGTDRQGYAEGGSELQMTARSMARFGLLYLNRGYWGSASVVPEQWTLDSTRPHKRVDYGFLWNYLPAEWGGPAVSALGYGGQAISIVPDASTVIVVASTADNPQNDVMRLLREVLIPHVRQ